MKWIGLCGMIAAVTGVILYLTLSDNIHVSATAEPTTPETDVCQDSPMPIPQTGWTEPVPASFFTPSEKPETVMRISYESKDYARNNASITKSAFVYLPYGYDENDTETRYNIFYFMHGWTGTADELFTIGNGEVKNIIDHMIENGDIPPMILVAATFDAENRPQDFGTSVRELRQFHQDFANHLMPAVEGQFHTYARSASKDDLAASRDHRAFGGFSLGAVTTWHQFCYNYDYIRYFLPMSGSCWYYGGYGNYHPVETCDFFESLIAENHLDERGYFIYACTGTRDAVLDQVEIQMREMLRRDDVFTPEHVAYYQKDGGVHDFNAVMEYLYNGLPVFFGGAGQEETMTKTAPFTAESAVRDVVSTTAFGDFGRLLFPVDRAVSDDMTLSQVSSSNVYVWYSNIKEEKTVEIINYLKDQAESGMRVFYPIYTESEMNADPSKRDTGLFFFRGTPGQKFAVMNAGGGFVYVGAMHDSFPHALEASKQGYNAFALIYRPDDAYADLARALSFIHDNAAELGVNPDGYSLWGGSAGARMAAVLGNETYLRELTGRTDIPQAAAVVMQYTGYFAASRQDAPTYACVGTSDGIAGWRTMQNRLHTLSGYGIPTEFHSYPGLSHGFGLGTGTVAEGWMQDALACWERNS